MVIIMAEPESLEVMEDLEDGEIESDGEQSEEPVVEPAKQEPEVQPPVIQIEDDAEAQNKTPHTEISPSKDKKAKKKSKEKSHHRSDREHKSHHKDKKSRKFVAPQPVEDDFAGNIEKAIRKAMKGNQEDTNTKNDVEIEDSGIDDADSKRKNKKRKKHGQPDKESSKKRKKLKSSEDEMDEDEMMCVRGASPVMKQAISPQYRDYSDDDYDSESSEESRDRGHSGRGRHSDRGRKGERGRGRSRRQDVHPNQDPDGVCLFFMQGKCYKGDDCTFSHDAHPPRKMELCKFYLMDCCAKKEKCLYLHSDFPCKYYHTGLPCIYKDDCKFAHGKPLSDSLKSILLKHIELAPKEILGEFPRLGRDAAAVMVAVTQNKLMQQYGMKPKEKDKSAIPSIFDLNIPKPPNFDEKQFNSNTSKGNEKRQKVRQSRWGDGNNGPQFNQTAPDDILSIHNLSGVLTPAQITQLAQLGIENLNQLNQLTVIQLNQLGLTLAQISDIQLNALSIQKLGLIPNPQSSTTPSLFGKLNKDLDMRVSPVIPDLSLAAPKQPELMVKDIDMRFHSNALQDKDTRHTENDPRKQRRKSNDSNNDKTPTASPDREVTEDNDRIASKDIDSRANMDYDHRVLQYISEATIANVKLSKDDDLIEDSKKEEDKSVNVVMKHQQQFLAHKKDGRTNDRRMTTDDEDDNNLQIDEKWYSSDEEKNDKLAIVENKIKSPPQDDHTPKNVPPQIQNTDLEATTVITKLGDLSKIDISAEVTKLLSTIKNNTTSEEKKEKKEDPRLRDPRNQKKSPEHKSSAGGSSSSVSKKSSKPTVVSIYNCLEGETEDTRKKSDVDLRLTNDVDFRLAKFGDTDLRQTSGSDVDLRLGLPFKSLPNYTPASEIDGSINSHPPITYKVSEIHIPKPNYTDIKNSTSKTQAQQDPRLRKVFRLSIDESALDAIEKKDKDSKQARIDPRKKSQDSKEDKEKSNKPPALDLQTVIQTSDWYKDLSTNQKILVNQQLACVTASLKKFHQDPNPKKTFDLTEIHSNNVLTKIFANLGIILNEKGEFAQVMLPDNTQNMMPQMNFMQNEMFNNMNMGGMNPMGNYDMRFQGNGQPGLLGIAPNIPHNFDDNFGNGMLMYNNDNNFNNGNPNMFNNGPGGRNMNEYNDNNYDESFYNNRNQNQKNDFNKPYSRPRGGNDRWRGSNRGRDRRGFTERGGSGGGWKGERRNNNNS